MMQLHPKEGKKNYLFLILTRHIVQEKLMLLCSIWICAKNRRFLEAPVSGSKGPAATGTLIFLCAGSKDLFDEIENNGLNVMGKASHFFSTTVGFGTRAKSVVNSLMGTMMAAYGEGLCLAENVGLDPSKLIEVIGQGAIQVCTLSFLKNIELHVPIKDSFNNYL